MRFSTICILLLPLCGPLLQAEIRVTDLRGREIVLEQPAERIILGEGRFLAALGVLDDNPLDRVAGMTVSPSGPLSSRSFRRCR